MRKPKVSVIMPVYNGEKYLKEAVESVLKQSFKDFELIIINDGSVDKTEEILKGFKDKRIKVFKNDKNLGVAESLNIGLENALGEYIARADADDINKSKRLKIQVSFLDNHPEYVLVGSNAQLIDADGGSIGFTKLPEDNFQIKQKIYIRNPFLHPSVMFRKKEIMEIGGYCEQLNGAEDYDLWLRLLKKGNFKNLNVRLIKRRLSNDVVTQQLHFKVELLALIARLKNFPLLRNLGLDFAVGIFTFLLYRFWLNFLLFSGRSVPPEPDDSYFYLSAANHLFSVNTFERFRLLLYSIWLNLISLITRLNWEKTYYLSFYLGILLMFIALIYFFRKLEANVLARIILISFLGLFTGSGVYQGFYWVTPSFFELLFFFLLSSMVLSVDNVSYFWIIFFSFLFIFIHPSSILILLAIFLESFIFSLFKKRWQITQIKKGIMIMVSSFIFYVIYTILSFRFSQIMSPESPFSSLNLLTNFLSGKISLISWQTIWDQYFHFLFLNPVTGVVFIACLAFCFIMKKFEILAIYAALLLLVLLSAVLPYGYRSLEFIWPITFIIFGYGLIGFFIFLSRKKFKISLFFSSVAFLFFFILATFLNIAWVTSVESSQNYSWDKNCSDITSQDYPGRPIYFYSRDGFFAFLTTGFPDKLAVIPSQNHELSKGELILINEKISAQNSNYENVLSSFLTKNITRANKNTPEQLSDQSFNYWIFPSLKSSIKTKILINCGFFKVKEIL